MLQRLVGLILRFVRKESPMTQDGDKLFKKIGYKKENTLFYLLYKKNDAHIQFYHDTRTVIKIGLNEEGDRLNMGELKAIYIKCKEMGWV